MPVIASNKIVELAQAADAKKALIDNVGDISKVRITGQNLFVATYIRPEKTRGGIIRPESNVREDEFQGNVGLVLKVGEAFNKEDAEDLLHQWVMFGYNDGLRYRYNDVPCRTIHVDRVRQIVPDPSKVL